jgi:hypothetical protein
LKDRIPGSAATEPLRAFAAPSAARPAAPRFAPLIVAGIGGLVLLAVLVFVRLLLAPPAPMALPAAAASAAPAGPTAAPALALAEAPDPIGTSVAFAAQPVILPAGTVASYAPGGEAYPGDVAGARATVLATYIAPYTQPWVRLAIDGHGELWVPTAALVGYGIPPNVPNLAPTITPSPAYVAPVAPAAPPAPIYLMEPTPIGAVPAILGTAAPQLPPNTPTPCPAPLIGTGCKPLVVAP